MDLFEALNKTIEDINEFKAETEKKLENHKELIKGLRKDVDVLQRENKRLKSENKQLREKKKIPRDRQEDFNEMMDINW